MDKLERWADERKKHLEYQIEDMDRAIRQHKADARKAASLDARLPFSGIASGNQTQ